MSITRKLGPIDMWFSWQHTLRKT